MMDRKRTLIATTATLLLSLQGCGVETAEFITPGERPAAAAFSHSSPVDESEKTSAHKVRFYHPANKSGGEETRTLYQDIEDADAPYRSDYYMDVPSVYCGEGICKIDIVRLHWDWLGRYTHFSLEPPTDLEKGNEEDFTEADYQKLQSVLSNRESGLADLSKDELILPNAGGERVDGLTGATVSLRKSDYVEGAIWTCYTLWHFANGALTGLIRNLSGDELPAEELPNLIVSDRDAEASFALQQVARQGLESDRIDTLVKQLLAQQKTALYPDVFDYLETLPTERSFRVLREFANTDDSKLRLEIIAHLQKTDEITDRSLLIDLSLNASQWDSFHEVHRLLALLRQHAAGDAGINQSISTLLNHDNFVIARKAYWYLAEAPEGSIDQALLESFRQQNLARL
ncbi:hypothetical protein [Microbulbifer elongatus]|uniref:hypothetical protein n=1 Tax=Microbulbifer elongatus TaxID=86173 RepID=UPI001CFE08C3|nr:hypothetical protein [Microbulbifer elongatus]